MLRRRLIVNTDAKNEADDQFAIVHALLSPSVDVVGVIPAHFGTGRTDRSMEESREEVDLLLGLLGMEVEVADGAPHALPDEATPVDSPGARLIIREAREPGPLHVIFLGPLTDMAAALLLDPGIAANPDLTVVWIGGHPYDGVHPDLGGPIGEFNLSNDVAAANVVLGSGVAVRQIPWTVYDQVGVGYAELDAKVAPHGELGEYLVRQLKELNATLEEDMEYRSLGDSPAVGAALSRQCLRWRVHPVRRFTGDARMSAVIVPGRTVWVADSCDTRWLMEDMFAKIAAFAAR